MTTEERIAAARLGIESARETMRRFEAALKKAEQELFRERHGFSLGDWILFHGEPGKVCRITLRDSPY